MVKWQTVAPTAPGNYWCITRFVNSRGEKRYTSPYIVCLDRGNGGCLVPSESHSSGTHGDRVRLWCPIALTAPEGPHERKV